MWQSNFEVESPCRQYRHYRKNGELSGRIEIDDVPPVVSGGTFPAKAVVGEVVPVRATVWREGHDAVAATLVVRHHGTRLPAAGRRAVPAEPEPVPIEAVVSPLPRIKPQRLPMSTGRAPDVFHGQFVPDAVGLWTFRVDGWGDPIATWRKAVIAKLDAGQSEAELSNDLLIGAKLLERAATGVPRQDRIPLLDAAAQLRAPGEPSLRAGAALTPELTDLLSQYPLRELVTRGEQYGVWVDRPGRASRPGTSCSPGPRGRRRRGRPVTALSRRPPRRCRVSPGWASTWSTCRRSTRSARSTARAATTR